MRVLSQSGSHPRGLPWGQGRPSTKEISVRPKQVSRLSPLLPGSVLLGTEWDGKSVKKDPSSARRSPKSRHSFFECCHKVVSTLEACRGGREGRLPRKPVSFPSRFQSCPHCFLVPWCLVRNGAVNRSKRTLLWCRGAQKVGTAFASVVTKWFPP